MADLTGRCACGQVRWTSPGPVLWAGHCHCDSCRRATSSPFTSFFGVPRATCQIIGRLAERRSSGGQVRRQHCPECGAQITYQYVGWPDETHLYAATLDDPAAFQPQAHYHFAEALPWVRITDSLPRYAASAENADPLP